jgi:FdhE protein
MTFEQRSERAALLARQSDAAREVLEFAAAVTKAQAKCADRLQPVTLSGRLTDDADKLVTLITPVLKVIADHSDDAEKRLDDSADIAKTRLQVFWSNGHADYIARALLQPYAEVLRARKVSPDREHSRGHCPFCGGAPWVALRRSEPDAESGFRYLQCSLCALEWRVNRVHCPSCFEEDPHKLPQFQNDVHKNVRIEACETCRRYVKSIDLTIDARPVPAVDDLLSLSMDLWAAEEGFTRLEPGLAGI